MHLGVAVLGFLGLASQGGGRSFSSKPAWASTLFSVLDCSGWCWDDRPETTATQSTANKALHSSPAGQWLFCLTFACSCKWFIKNCSIFLVSCTLNGQIFFSCNSVLDSLCPFALFPVCTVIKPECCVLEVKRAMKLSIMADAVVILHKNQVSMCITSQNTTRKRAWVFSLPHFVGGEAEA